MVGVGRIRIGGATGKDADDGGCNVKAPVRVGGVFGVPQDSFIKVVS